MLTHSVVSVGRVFVWDSAWLPILLWTVMNNCNYRQYQKWTSLHPYSSHSLGDFVNVLNNLWYTLFLVNGLLFLKVMYRGNPKKNIMSISWVSGNWSLIYLYELLDCFWLNNWLWMSHQVFCLRQVGKKCWLFRQVLRALDERHCYHRAKWNPVWSEQ